MKERLASYLIVIAIGCGIALVGCTSQDKTESKPGDVPNVTAAAPAVKKGAELTPFEKLSGPMDTEAIPNGTGGVYLYGTVDGKFRVWFVQGDKAFPVKEATANPLKPTAFPGVAAAKGFWFSMFQIEHRNLRQAANDDGGDSGGSSGTDSDFGSDGGGDGG